MKLLLLGVFILIPSQAFGEESSKYYKDRTVKIYSTGVNDEGQSVRIQGSGVCVSSNGYIMTIAHLFHASNSKSCVVEFNSHGKFPGKVFWAPESFDKGYEGVVIVKLNGVTRSLPFLNIGNTPSVGDVVYFMGFPKGKWVSNRAIVNTVSSHIVGEEFYLIGTTVQAYGGNSGGPLLNITGGVIGILSLAPSDKPILSGGGVQVRIPMVKPDLVLSFFAHTSYVSEAYSHITLVAKKPEEVPGICDAESL